MSTLVLWSKLKVERLTSGEVVDALLFLTRIGAIAGKTTSSGSFLVNRIYSKRDIHAKLSQ